MPTCKNCGRLLYKIEAFGKRKECIKCREVVCAECSYVIVERQRTGKKMWQQETMYRGKTLGRICFKCLKELKLDSWLR